MISVSKAPPPKPAHVPLLGLVMCCPSNTVVQLLAVRTTHALRRLRAPFPPNEPLRLIPAFLRQRSGCRRPFNASDACGEAMAVAWPSDRGCCAACLPSAPPRLQLLAHAAALHRRSQPTAQRDASRCGALTAAGVPAGRLVHNKAHDIVVAVTYVFRQLRAALDMRVEHRC